MGRRFQRTPRRGTYWVDGATGACIGATAVAFATPPVSTHFNLIGTSTERDKATLVRMVGEVDVNINSDSVNFLPAAGGSYRSLITVFMGIQIVNRVQGAAGVPRDPHLVDDRQGGEWLWMRSVQLAWHMYSETATTTLTNWFVPTWNVGGYDPHVDIRVKRKLDLLQDDVVFSLSAATCIGPDQLVESTMNLRGLLMDT